MGKVILSGVSKGMTVPSTDKPISKFAVGSLVKLNEGGSPVEFYVACHDYESVLNGTGRTLLVRKDCYDSRIWKSSDLNNWANSDLRSWLNGTYLNMLDEDIRGVIGTTKYYYTPGNGSTAVTTRSDAVFQLSVTELGRTNYANVEGTALPIAGILQIAYLNDSTVFQWTRSPYKSGNYEVCYLDTYGGSGYQSEFGSCGSRPALTLPSTVLVTKSGNVKVAV